MTTGETLLKITDYPFSYSVTVIIFIWIGVNVQEAKLLGELGVAGAIGTFLTIVDPLGRLFKFGLKRHFKKYQQKGDGAKLLGEYQIRAIKTKSIGIEIDKIVGLVYFLLVIFLFGIALISSPTFALDISPKDKNEKPLWDLHVLQIGGAIGSIIAMIILGIIGVKNRDEVTNHVVTVGTYEYGISSPFATRETIESMSNAVDQNDWPTAEEWAKIVEHEIEIKKAKKNEIINQAELIYEPLYQESLQIEGAIKSSTFTKTMPTFSFAEWQKIKNGSIYLNIQDLELKDQIEKFYDLIEKYQHLWGKAYNKSEQIVQSAASAFYSVPVIEIRCIIKTKDGERGIPELQHLLLTNTYPTDYYPAGSTLSSIEIRIQNGNNIRKDSEQDFQHLKQLWSNLLDKAKEDADINELRNLFEQISKMSPIIKIQLMRKIREKWEA